MAVKHLNIHVFGLVQGVSFRASTQDQAEVNGLTGFVCNQWDGSVCIEVEGQEEDLADFVRWCNKGPSMAQVTRTEVSEGLLQHFTEFQITWPRR